MSKTVKTNALRRLDTAGIPYQTLAYPADEAHLDGEAVAQAVGLNPAMVFKTLVLRGERSGLLVCCIPVCRELDLKAAAQAAGDKKVEMLPMKELLPTTGYLRGGCSPVGMKKAFPTYFDESALHYPQIAVSAGQRGLQMLVPPQALITLTTAQTAPLTRQG